MDPVAIIIITLAVLLAFHGAPQKHGSASAMARGAFSWRAVVHSLVPFFHSSVRQIHTDILVPSPRGVHATVRETDGQIDHFISVR